MPSAAADQGTAAPNYKIKIGGQDPATLKEDFQSFFIERVTKTTTVVLSPTLDSAVPWSRARYGLPELLLPLLT